MNRNPSTSPAQVVIFDINAGSMPSCVVSTIQDGAAGYTVCDALWCGDDLLSAGDDYCIKMWDARKSGLAPLASYMGHTSCVRSLPQFAFNIIFRFFFPHHVLTVLSTFIILDPYRFTTGFLGWIDLQINTKSNHLIGELREIRTTCYILFKIFAICYHLAIYLSASIL
jgi:WD40 repeat protein